MHDEFKQARYYSNCICQILGLLYDHANVDKITFSRHSFETSYANFIQIALNLSFRIVIDGSNSTLFFR